MADGVFRGALLGTLWGAVADLEIAEFFSEAPAEGNRYVRRFNAIWRSAGAFALFVGLYSGGCCVGEKVTGERDHYLSSAMGGACAGSLFGLRSVGTIPTTIPTMQTVAGRCLAIGAATGLFSGLVKYVQG